MTRNQVWGMALPLLLLSTATLCSSGCDKGSASPGGGGSGGLTDTGGNNGSAGGGAAGGTTGSAGAPVSGGSGGHGGRLGSGGTNGSGGAPGSGGMAFCPGGNAGSGGPGTGGASGGSAGAGGAGGRASAGGQGGTPICPVINDPLPPASTAKIGQPISVGVRVYSPDLGFVFGPPGIFSWTATSYVCQTSGGTFADPTASATSFTCTVPGDVSVAVQIGVENTSCSTGISWIVHCSR